MGLSTEALKYSLSFADDWFIDQFENVSAAREEFLDFYKARNYSSLLEYFSDISQDLHPKENSSGSATWYEPRSCHIDTSNTYGRTTMGRQFCYIFRLKPMEHGFGIYSGIRWVEIQYQSKTGGLLEDSDDWGLYFNPWSDVFTTTHPGVTLRSSRRNTVELTVQKFVSLNCSASPCRASVDGDTPYSPVACMAKCHNALYHQNRGCKLLWLVQSHLEMTPEDICNWADRVPPDNLTLKEFFTTEVNEHIDSVAADVCVRQCPLTCEKTMYDTILHMQQSYPELELRSAKEANASLIQVFLRHGSPYQGGMLTSQEMYSYSLTQLVNNIGGTLGLFVGATLMTFVQLLLFCISYISGIRVRARFACGT